MEHEERLFQRWRQRGDAQALGELFDRTAPGLLKLAIHLVGDASAAEDLVQATFLALIEQRERVDASRPIEPWLAGVLTNKARELRRAARKVVDPARLEQRLAEDASAPAERRELHGEVARAIDQLSEPYRQVVLLSLRHAMAPGDVAHVLGRDAGTVRVQLHRGLEKLRKLLPAALASSLALAVIAPRGLAAVKAHVLEQALLAAPVTAGGTLVGGLVMSKLAVVVVVAALAAVLWFLNGRGGAPAHGPLSVAETSAREIPPPTSAPELDAATRAPATPQQRAEVSSPPPDTSAHVIEVVDALTRAPLSGASLARHAGRSTNVRELLRDRPEEFAMSAQGRLEPRTHADWPALVGASDEGFAGRAALLALDVPGEAAPLELATSDANGRATLSGGEGKWLLEVALDGYATRYRPVDANALPSRVELWPERRIEGRCTVHWRPYSGAPLELAISTAGPSAEDAPRDGVCVRRVVTDRDGRFTVAVGGAQAYVRVLSPGWTLSMDWLLRCDESEWQVDLQPLATVRVLDASDGSPLEWVHLLAHHAQSGFAVWSSLAHAPNGLLTLPGAAGRPGFPGLARFKLWAPGYAPQFVEEPERPSPEPIVLRLERETTPAFSGRVLEAGAPLEGSSVSLHAHAPSIWWTPGTAFHRALVDATTTANGRFVLHAPAGVYLLEVKHGATYHVRVVEHPVADELKIDLARLPSLEVEIVDRNGAPQVGHVVGLNASDQRAERRHTDERGIARFEHLPSLPGSVFAPHRSTEAGFTAEVKEDFVLGDGEQRRVKLVVRGTSAVRRALVVARGTSDYSGWRARFGEQPWEELSPQGVIPMDLATPEWTAEVLALDGRRWTFDIPKNADDGHVIELDGGKVRLHGIVRVPSGAPLAGWWIEAQPWSDCARTSRARARCDIAADGRFEFAGLAPCVHRLRMYDGQSKLRAEFTPTLPPATESRSLEILLDPPRGELRLSGVVRRKSGSPVAGALLTIESITPGADGALRLLGKEPVARTDERGRYSIALPRTAQHEISVFADLDRSRAAQETVLDDGRSERTLDFEVD